MTGSASIAPAKEVRRSERIDELVLHEIAYSPGFRIGWHSHELAAFALTLTGSSSEAFANTQFDQMEGAVLVRPAGERHWDSMGNHGARSFLIEFSPAWGRMLPELGSVLNRLSFYQLGPMAHLARRAYHEWGQNDGASKLAVHALALEMAAHLMRDGAVRSYTKPPAWLRRVRQRLDEAFTEAPSMAELGKISGVHPSHLARHFRQCYGASIGEYVRQRRVDAAANLLSHRDLSLTEIALATGFAHHAHFTTVFKHLTGLTPSEFRRLRHTEPAT
jgi:AraC family transcriptional regulator